MTCKTGHILGMMCPLIQWTAPGLVELGILSSQGVALGLVELGILSSPGDV